MVHYFPQPFPDEILYSVIGRYLLDTLSGLGEYSRNALCLSLHQRVSIHTPLYVGRIVKATNHLVDWDEEQIISKHTIWPFLVPFLHGPCSRGITKHRCGLSKYTVGPGIRKAVVFPSVPLYCPLCNLEDIEIFGAIYWKRIHQLPGILVCPKHDVFLEQAASSKPIKQGIIVPVIDNCPVKKARQNTFPLAGLVASDLVSTLFSCRHQYNYSQLYANSPWSNENELIQGFKEFYGEPLLSIYSVFAKKSNNFENLLPLGPFKNMDPLAHILFRRFLVDSIR